MQMSFESRHFFYLAGNSLNIIISQAIDVAARLTNYAEWMDSNANFERTRDRAGKEIARLEGAEILLSNIGMKQNLDPPSASVGQRWRDSGVCFS